jgi:hypothetical protein
MVALNSVEMDEAIRSDAALRSKVEHANEVLSGIVGRSATRVSAEWRRERGPQTGTGARIVLRLRDETGETTAPIADEELDASDRLWSRLWRVWSERLRDGSQRQIDHLRDMVSQLEDEE